MLVSAFTVDRALQLVTEVCEGKGRAQAEFISRNGRTFKKKIAFKGHKRGDKRVSEVFIPLRQVLKQEVQKGHGQCNAVASIGALRPEMTQYSKTRPKAEPKRYTQAELDAITRAALKHNDEQAALMCDIGPEIGTSIGELLGIKWDCVNFDTKKGGGSVMLKRKLESSGKRGIIEEMKTASQKKDSRKRNRPFTAKCRAAFTALKKYTFFKDHGACFENPRTGRPWKKPSDFLRRWRRYLAAAGVTYRGPNQFRHTFATRRVNEERNWKTVAKEMGHTTPQMLMNHYAGEFDEKDAPIKEQRKQ